MHGDLAEVFSQPFEDNADNMRRQFYVGLVVEQVKGARTVELQGCRYPAGLRLRLFEKLLVQVLEQRRLAVPDPQGHIPVNEPHTAVNHRLFDGLQTVLAAHHQLAQGQQKIRFHRKRAFVIVQVKLDVHWVDMAGGAGSDFHHLAAQPTHQRGIFPHRIDNDDPVFGDSEKHVDDLALCGKTLAGARGAEIKAVGRFQLFAVSHDDVVGKGVHTVVEGRPGHPQLPGHKGNENRRGAGSHATLDFHLVIAQGQGRNEALLLLPVQPLQSAVVFLCDTAHREHVILQPLAGGGKVYHREREQEHPLVSGLQVSQKLRRILAERNEVRGQNVGIVPGPHRLALFLHLHFADVGELALDGLNGLELIHRLNMERNRHFRIQLQDLRQELVRELGRQNLQVGRRAPILADAERPGLPEVEAVRRDIVLCAKPGFGDVLPGEAERLPVAGVHLAVKQGQPRLPVHRDRGNAQPFEVACHVGLHPFQAGAGLRDPLGGQAERDIF